MSGDPTSESVLAAAARAVRDAPDIDAALASLAGLLRVEFRLWRASIRIPVPGTDLLRVASVWSMQETMLRPGVTMSRFASSLPEVEKLGGALVFSGNRPGPRFADQILHEEGIRSWVSVPLRREGATIGLLSFSSREVGAFSQEDAGFFTELGAAVDERLIELLPPASDDARQT